MSFIFLLGSAALSDDVGTFDIFGITCDFFPFTLVLKAGFDSCSRVEIGDFLVKSGVTAFWTDLRGV